MALLISVGAISTFAQVPGGCYSLRLANNNKLLINVNGVLKVQSSNNTNAQIFALTIYGTPGMNILAPGSSGGFIYIPTDATLGNPIVFKRNFPPVDINYSGTVAPIWYAKLISDGNPGNKYGFILNKVNGPAPPNN